MRELSVAGQHYEAEPVKYEAGGLEGLADGSHRPRSCPHQMPAVVEVALVELRLAHPRTAGADRTRSPRRHRRFLEQLRGERLRGPSVKLTVNAEAKAASMSRRRRFGMGVPACVVT